MADTASLGVLATLLPVLLGGAIALAGTWLGPWISDRRKDKVEQRKQRDEKFEELVAAIFEFDHWVENEFQISAYGKEQPELVSPFWKVHAISAVYFPQFERAITQLDDATGAYKVWMTEAGYKRAFWSSPSDERGSHRGVWVVPWKERRIAQGAEGICRKGVPLLYI